MPRNDKSKGHSHGMLVAGRANRRHAKPTKAEKRLQARIRDFESTVGSPQFKAPMGAYHRPGSNQS